ncbi:phytoene desaturase family protein [Actinoalloteichus hymeniacidonis]|uniref:Phytoene dehydrogenase-like oxidoreductase n=1 Tax=Actinoalloteichus hymeniacidonis TaxID=340345 RepID=A0AAC9MXQ2_9PSEU|nr:NAD(P)/FAD-dependent oxidoreductase [Actinoalloteichus hymeniacidonis]AOS63523.1 phytoene dehydrogenase-like oxidoreductase [Actinoalloteichus hymeniacidonis]MBB5908433.1 phytoene dehydrogenase-like protein [Actinoalloteichus hymeniacidonis]
MARDLVAGWDRRDRAPGDKPRVLVIGAGIAGMSTGCYAQMSGMETRILEKHVLPGGCCTAWAREGYIFDYTIEWLIGTAEGNDANQLWRELGAFDGKTIKNFAMFNKVVDSDGRSVVFYNDPDRLERHLLEISPADAKLIRAFCRDLRRFIPMNLYPFLTPPPLESVGEKIAKLRTILPAFVLYWRTAATQMKTFADKFADPLLRKAFRNIFFQDPEDFPLLPFLFNMAAAHNDNAGFPQGGSLGLARSIEERYLGLGGDITYRARVARILVEDDRAVGVELKGGERLYADHVVAACDGRTTIYDFLDGRYTGPTIDRLYDELLTKPGTLFPAVVSAFVGIEGDLDADRAHSTTYLLPDSAGPGLPGSLQNSIVVQLRSQYSDGFAPEGKSVIHCTYFSDYSYWKSLRNTDRREYRAQKRQIAEFVREFLVSRLPELAGRIDLVDIATPATTNRYTGNFDGSILAWKAFSDADDLAAKLINKEHMRLPGLRGFSMAGQWVGLGGLIRAASTGRFVTQFLCAELGVEFQAWESSGTEPWHPDKLGHLPQLDARPVR